MAPRILKKKVPEAPVQRPVPAPREGVLAAMDTRALGLAVVGLGGGRQRASDAVDPRVGLDGMLPIGQAVRRGDALAVVHAASVEAADAAVAAVLSAIRIDDSGTPAAEVVVEAVVAVP